MARKRYVPLSVHFAHGQTGTALLQELGRDGLLVWVCLIAAAKRSSVPGQFIHLSDAETWEQFGIASDPPKVAFEDVLRVTGRMKQTARRRHGRMLYVTLTHYGDWNDAFRTDIATTQKSSKRAESKPDTTVAEVEVEVEGEREVEVEKKEPRAKKPPAPPSPTFLAHEAIWGKATNQKAKKKRDTDVAALTESVNGLPPEDIEPDLRRRIENLWQRWGGRFEVTANALANNWNLSDTPPRAPLIEKKGAMTLADDWRATADGAMRILDARRNGHAPLTADLDLPALEETYDG